MLVLVLLLLLLVVVHNYVDLASILAFLGDLLVLGGPLQYSLLGSSQRFLLKLGLCRLLLLLGRQLQNGLNLSPRPFNIHMWLGRVDLRPLAEGF